MAVVCRGKEVHPMLAGFQIITFAEALAGIIAGVVHGNAGATQLAHHGKAGYIRRPVSQVNHVLEGDGAQIAVHVVVNVLRIVKHALVDTEQELCFSGMRDNAFGKIDAAVGLAELTGKHLFHVGAYDRAVYNGFNAAGDNVKLNVYACKAMLRAEGSLLKGLEKLRYAAEEGEFFAQLTQCFVAYAVYAEGIEQLFEVTELTVPTFLLTAVVALFPKQFSIDAELGEDGVLLHVVGAESLVKVKDKCDCVLRYGHNLLIPLKV